MSKSKAKPVKSNPSAKPALKKLPVGKKSKPSKAAPPLPPDDDDELEDTAEPSVEPAPFPLRLGGSPGTGAKAGDSRVLDDEAALPGRVAFAPAPRVTRPVPVVKVAPEIMAELRSRVVEAEKLVDAVSEEADRIREESNQRMSEARSAYAAVLVPYRDACRRAGVACEFGGGRTANVSASAHFVVERQGEKVRIMLRDRPETEEFVAVDRVRTLLAQVAYGYTDKHVGPREVVGNKGGTLSNKLRAAVG